MYIILSLFCGFLLYPIITTIWSYVIDTYMSNEYDFPIDSRGRFCHIFSETTAAACHYTAKSIFGILTGIKIDCINILCSGLSNHNFDNNDTSNHVSYIEFVWCDNCKYNQITSLYHALVYYDGYIYQSYRTKRYNIKWFHFLDAYPMIRFPVRKSDRHLFEGDIGDFSISDFNRICAPSKHPIPNNSIFRCQRIFKAVVNPTRENINLAFDLQ